MLTHTDIWLILAGWIWWIALAIFSEETINRKIGFPSHTAHIDNKTIAYQFFWEFSQMADLPPFGNPLCKKQIGVYFAF